MRGSEILCLKTTVIEPLKQELQEADASVASAASEALESYKTTVNQKFDTVEGNITALDSQLDTLSGSLSTMNETVSSLSGEVDSVAESVTTLAGEVESGDAEAMAAVEEVSNEITALENKLFGLVLPTAENVTHTGVQVSPEWDGYDPGMLTISGQTSGMAVATYTVTFTPITPYRWTDGTTVAKQAQWQIV